MSPVWRGLQVTAVLVVTGVRLLFHRDRGVVLAAALIRLGPMFVKVAQLLSTRVDVLPPEVCRGLGRLHDGLPPVPVSVASLSLPPALVADLETMTHAAAGSIACVYRARLRDGRIVAVKVRRPDIERVVRADLVLLRNTARVMQAFGVPVADVVAELGRAVLQQLDLAAEADALRALRVNLAGIAGLRIPAVLEKYCGPGVLVMEHVDGLRGGTASPAATITALRAVYQMLFLDGLVHCDLHPGNLYQLPDGSAVIVDAGFCRRLSPPARRAFAAFFYRMSRSEGAACADIVLATASGGQGADPAGFRASMIRLVGASDRAVVADFDLVRFAVRLFAAQRAHGYRADPEFTFPILSLVVLEGTLRQVCPDVDFQREALPFVLRGLMR